MTPAKFVREVRQEARRVVWPTRKETLVTSAMVLVLAAVMAIFFLGVDQILAFGVKTLIASIR